MKHKQKDLKTNCKKATLKTHPTYLLYRSQTWSLTSCVRKKKSFTTTQPNLFSKHHVYAAKNMRFIKCENSARYAPAGVLRL